MSADDQAFLDILSSVPNDIRRYSNEVADYVDRHLEKVSNTLREALSSSEWIPESARPRPRPPPRSFIEAPSPASAYTQVYRWVMRNKILTAAIIVVAGGVTYHIVKSKSSRKKRRAKRAANGARVEVVVVAGSPSEPITRSISLDLERRGFIVYIVCNTIEEEVLVQNESRPDIKPLMIDIVDPESAHASIERFTNHLQTPHSAIPGIKPHHLSLAALVLIPSLSYPSLPVATLPPSTFSDLVNTRLLSPILTLQAFLPLLQSLPLAHPHQKPSQAVAGKASVLILTPNIISSLSPAFHLPESAIVSALTSFTQVLSAELAPLSIPVTHLRLGTFDFSTFSSHNRQLQPYQSVQAQRAETLKWDEGARQAYGRNFVSVNSGRVGGGGATKGSSLRGLNNAVFDAIIKGRGGVVHVGMGSTVYGFVGRWMPRGLVGWMMGVRRVTLAKGEFGRVFGEGDVNVSRATSPGSSASGGNIHGFGGLGESEYVPVYGDVSNDLEEGDRSGY